MRKVGSTGILMECLPQASIVISWRDGPVSAITLHQGLGPWSVKVRLRTQYIQGGLFGHIPVRLIVYHGYRPVAFRNSSRLPLDSKGGTVVFS